MPEIKSVCVVDCNEWFSRYQFSDHRITAEDMSAVLVSATLLAVDNLYVDPILSIDSILTTDRASVMARSISVQISDQLCDALTALDKSEVYDAHITTDSRVEDGMVILTLNVIEDEEHGAI